ncbi:uncharacterized protein LOC131663673 [Phymastichus coffea]|uniref:uncharacterized protein LOC131663673 n=1 Tax=Phymastichus coffea TaxID=108790 RepID=UPI00273B9116|nr:uncharacterized protein LOC131663673 [Phymastichus coffea]
MPARAVRRTPEEQRIFQEAKRLRDRENLCHRRQAARDRLRVRTTGIDEDYLGPMNVLCSHCNAKHFQDEKISNKGLSFSDCCSHGSALLDPLPTFPSELQSLFTGNNPKSNLFIKDIRSYNNSLAFASLNANLFNFTPNRPGPFCFKIQGQIYYQINTALYPNEGENPSFGQLFIVDQLEALNYRLSNNSTLDFELLKSLDTIIRENNIFAQSYEMMRVEIERQQALEDRRRYNFQRVNEVAAVFSTTADGEIPESYVTFRNKRTKDLKFVSTMNPNVEPWIYPLFYPYGTQGWHKDILRVNSVKRVSRMAYYRHRMAIRLDEFNPFIIGGRLFQQWVVDSYVKVEKDRIQYCKDHQKELKADTYKRLSDYMQNTAEEVGGQVGKTVILPSSFTGSPRYMQQCYQDAMALVNEKENLLPGQQTSDRPDIVARIFHLKKERIIDLIVKKKFFGEVAAYVYVIEFQKRGLPHMHLLITLANGYKWTTPEIVDKFISAEFPIKENNPQLYDIILKHMVHGPCDDWCMENDKCSKNFPKSFQDEITMDENGFPNYRRRNTGYTHQRSNGHQVDNRWIVPHCSHISELFDCHINVEAVSSIMAVKYLYKYIYKGHDAATVVIQDSENSVSIYHDEIYRFINTRYVGPVESVYRLLSKTLQDKSHTIIRLPIHLPNHQSIIISYNPVTLETLNSASSMLLDYFKLNLENEIARQYYYSEIPQHFTHIKKKNGNISKWSTRKKHFNVIGRMYSISPTQLELFHLRMLLLHVKGAVSFESLRTVENTVHPTFVAACLALGLIENDEEWKLALEEGTKWMMPQRLRHLFVRILIHCQPLNPEELWNHFKNPMSEDFSRHHEESISHRLAYSYINTLLNNEGRSLADFPTMDQTVDIEFLIPDQSNENNPSNVNRTDISLEQMANIGQQRYNTLNPQQKEIVDIVFEAAHNLHYTGPRCIYMDGPGGSGKTYVYETIYYKLTSENIKICSMAFTGIAATLLPNGKTVHKTFGLPVPLFQDSSSNIKAQSQEAQILRETDVFIWDEISMAPRYALKIVNKTLQNFMDNNLPFGGKIIIVGGDLKQLLPIKVRGTRSEILSLCVVYSKVWKYFTKFSLTANIRVLPNEIEFSKFLLDIGNGTLNDQNDCVNLPEHCILPPTSNIIDDTFGILMKENKFQDMCKCAILSARNVDVDDINKQITNLLNKDSERIYTAIDVVVNNNGELDDLILPEHLHNLNPTSLPPHELRLRQNCIIMLIRNISINEGDKTNEVEFLNRITLYSENNYPFSFKRRQFPIKLAFAMTINKAQGQTFNKTTVDLRRDVFNHGQLYVAMSRVRSWDSIKIYLGNYVQLRKVKNLVYNENYTKNNSQFASYRNFNKLKTVNYSWYLRAITCQ